MELGNPLLLAEPPDGVIVDGQLDRDRAPADPRPLAPSLQRRATAYGGGGIRALGPDRGVCRAANQALLKAKDIDDGLCPKPPARLKERLLTELGFVSAQRPTTTRGVNRAWSEHFDELVQYKVKHGDCNVPMRWPDNRGLGIWVSNQRQLKKQGELDPERERMLNEIGFEW